MAVFEGAYRTDQIDTAIARLLSLPIPTSAENGKVLGIKNGEWAFLSNEQSTDSGTGRVSYSWTQQGRIITVNLISDSGSDTYEFDPNAKELTIEKA